MDWPEMCCGLRCKARPILVMSIRFAGPTDPLSGRMLLSEPIVITGVGLITALGQDCESVWDAVRRGDCGVGTLTGIPGLPEGLLAATVDLPEPNHKILKVTQMSEIAAEEAMQDAKVDFDQIDRNRFGCWIGAHMGDDRGALAVQGIPFEDPSMEANWFEQWLPNTTYTHLAQKFGLQGPGLCHSTACASGLIEMLSATRALRDGQCDIALVGSGESVTRLLTAGFQRMGVLAFDEDPTQACRPFDQHRHGFVLGEGAAMFVVERLGHALRRGAKIYAEVRSCRCMGEAHHITGLNENAATLVRLIHETLQDANLTTTDIGYVNAHGTATEQNDRVEMRGIHQAMGDQNKSYCVSATKAMHGHLLNAAGCVELALTILAMRDGYAPPTLNLTHPDAECRFDGVPLVGRANQFQHSLKLSLAFGGHLVAVALSRWNDVQSGFSYPSTSAVKAA